MSVDEIRFTFARRCGDVIFDGSLKTQTSAAKSDHMKLNIVFLTVC